MKGVRQVFPAGSASQSRERTQRVLEVTEDERENGLAVDLGGEETFYVLHHEEGGLVRGDDTKVFPVEKVSRVLVVCCPAVAADDAGAANDGVCLARRTADEDPVILFTPQGYGDAGTDFFRGRLAEGCTPRFVPGHGKVAPVCAFEIIAGDLAPQILVVGSGNILGVELTVERAQEQGLVRPVVLFNREANFECLPLPIARE